MSRPAAREPRKGLARRFATTMTSITQGRGTKGPGSRSYLRPQNAKGGARLGGAWRRSPAVIWRFVSDHPSV
jgi:hypothetical protein